MYPLKNKEKIKEIYKTLNQPMTRFVSFRGKNKSFQALSQYNYVLMSGFETEEQAQEYIFKYYSDCMELLIQNLSIK